MHLSQNQPMATGIAGIAETTSLAGTRSAGGAVHLSQSQRMEEAETETGEVGTHTAAAGVVKAMHAATTVAAGVVETRRGDPIVVMITVDGDPRGARKEDGVTAT